MDSRDDPAGFYPLFSTLTRLETELWDAVDARLRKECGTTLGRYEAMVTIDSLGSCRVHDIASTLSITVGGTSKLIDRVEEAGHCVRKLNPDDRRSSLLELTAEGTALVEQGRTVVNAELSQWFTPALTKQEAAQFLELLSRLRDAKPAPDTTAAVR